MPPPVDPKRYPIRDIIYGLIGTVLAVIVVSTGRVGFETNTKVDRLDQLHMRVDVSRLAQDVASLKQIHEREWPLEIARLTLLNTQLRDRVSALETRNDRLEQAVEELR